MEYLKAAADLFIVLVPYRDGRLDAASVGAPEVLQFIKAGRLRCIATGTRER
jgi:tripartite-type tricarboxylate transporter receptor subunit TctC